VVLFASGQSDRKKQVQLRRAMEAAFEHNGIFTPHSKTPPISDDAEPTQSGKPTPIVLPIQSSPDAASEERIREVIRAQVAQRQLPQDAVSVRPSPDGLVVSLREAGFFGSGSAEVKRDTLEVLKVVALSLPHQPMRVEGHTDNLPIHTMQFATNWELSTARAASITRFLVTQRAADPAQISAAGYAEFRPIADNATEAGRTQNRRVDIILLKPGAATP
jgi:chemotaxis protein MotB